MEPQEDGADRPYEATPRKLADARKKGEIVRSQDTVALLLFAIFAISLSIVFFRIMPGIVVSMIRYLETATVSPEVFNTVLTISSVSDWLRPFILYLAVAPFVLIFVALMAAQQIVFVPDKLSLKFNRVSILANAKKKFGRSGLIEFAKTTFKFCVFAAIFSWFATNTPKFFDGIPRLHPNAALSRIYSEAMHWFLIATATYAVFAAIDLTWQVQEHARKNRMSHKELKDEHKNEEGDETIRQQRRAKAEEIATNRMLLDVPKAAVVITNPTHYAVALKWNGKQGTVPKCVARGKDETAHRIREVAMQSDVPIYEDPPTARKIFADVKVGMTIDHDHYKAVAIAISYARRIQQMARNNAR